MWYGMYALGHARKHITHTHKDTFKQCPISTHKYLTLARVFKTKPQLVLFVFEKLS